MFLYSFCSKLVQNFEMYMNYFMNIILLFTINKKKVVLNSSFHKNIIETSFYF